MDQEKIAKFILELRKKNNMSQSEFASLLNVTSQAVSKWENARGIPDIEILRAMSKTFKVDIESILDGEIKKKKIKYVIPATIVLLFIVISVILLVLFYPEKEYKLSDIKSDNELFEVHGVAAYQEDKKSIHINKLEIIDDSLEKYVVKDCSLYEEENDLTAKITDCSKIEKYESFDINKAKTLSQLLEGAEFHKDNYLSICEDLSNANLFIELNLIDENNKTIEYKIPLLFDYNCSIN